MSGGTPAQYTTMIVVLCAIAAAIAITVVVGRVRRARLTGAAEAGSVRSAAQAREIAERLFSFCSEGRPSTAVADGSLPRVRVRGAARLLTVMRSDDRFDTAPRDDDGYWAFVVRAPGSGSAHHQDRSRGMADILGRNGVTALGATAGE